MERSRNFSALLRVSSSFPSWLNKTLTQAVDENFSVILLLKYSYLYLTKTTIASILIQS